MADIVPLISDPLTLFILVLTAAILGLGKSGLLGSLGFATVPILALALPPKDAAGVILPGLVAMDIFAVWAYRKHFNRALVAQLIPGSLLGILVGWLFFAVLPDQLISLALGAITAVFCLYYWWPRQKKSSSQQSQNSAITSSKPTIGSSFWGTILGLTSFVAHAGAPPFAIYVLPQKLAPVVFASTAAITFAIVNAIKLPFYAHLGQLNITNLALAAILIPLAWLFLFVGIKLMHKIPTKLFYQITYPALFILGLKLIGDGLSLWG